MHFCRIRSLLIILLVLIAIPVGVAAQGTPAASPASGDISFELRGVVTSPGPVSLDDLTSLPPQTADVTYKSGDAEESHVYTGVLLFDLIDANGLVLDDSVKNDKLAKYIVVTGDDGYEAVIAYGDIDPDFGNQPVLVAYEEDGAPLDGARLVVPGDARGGRYVSGIATIEVRGVDDEPRT